MICPLGKFLKIAFLDEEKKRTFLLSLSFFFLPFLPFFYYLIDFFFFVHSEPFYASADRLTDTQMLLACTWRSKWQVLPWGLSMPVGGQTCGGCCFQYVTPEGLSLGRQASGRGAGAGLGGAWAEVRGRAEPEDPGFAPSAAGRQRGVSSRCHVTLATHSCRAQTVELHACLSPSRWPFLSRVDPEGPPLCLAVDSAILTFLVGALSVGRRHP